MAVVNKKSGIVSLVGRPNAGKSSLLNKILGSDLSIVTPKAQTTWSNLRGIVTEEAGQMLLVDTPGCLREEPTRGLKSSLCKEVDSALSDADLIWYVVGSGSNPEEEAAAIRRIKCTEQPLFLVFNKADLSRDTAALREAILKEIPRIKREFHVSATTGQGLKELIQESFQVLPSGEALFPDEDQISDRPLRYFAGEKVREQLFLQLNEEIPYSCAVRVEQFREATPENPKTLIEASVIVEKESQKAILIGKGGAQIKSIGAKARQNIEKWIEQPVYLKLMVKVWPKWRSNASLLEELGYHV